MRRVALLLAVVSIASISLVFIAPYRASAPEPEVLGASQVPVGAPAAAAPADGTGGGASGSAPAGSASGGGPGITALAALDPAVTPRTSVRGLVLPNPRTLTETAFSFADTSAPAEMHAMALQLRDRGQLDIAIELLGQVASGPSALAPMSELRLAQALRRAGRDAEAAEAFSNVIARSALPASLQAVAILEGAPVLDREGRRAEALRVLEGMEVLSGATASDLARARWTRAEILRDAGNSGWAALALDAMAVSPGTSIATDALDALTEENVAVPLFLAARVNYLARRNAAATAIYESLLKLPLTADERATAWFYLGALAERAGNDPAALGHYSNSIAANASGALADDSVYWRARIFEDAGNIALAVAEYDRLVREYPSSSFAGESALRAAVVLAFGGSPASALPRFEAIANSPSSTSANAALAARWHAVFRDRTGAAAAALDPTVFHPYALGAVFQRAGTQAISPLPAGATLEAPARIEWDAPAVAEWIAANVAPRPIATRSILDEPDLAFGRMLVRAGEADVARGLLSGLLTAYTQQPYDLAELTALAYEAGLYDVSLRSAARILNRVPVAARLEAPRSLLAAAYPAPYLDETLAASNEFGVPPLLLLALVRQESAFNPVAGSHAGAVGLTQVIHPTGKAIAAALGRPWDPNDLTVPSSSLRYGAFYLAEQIDLFDGNILPALAAYNAGPGNAARWLRNQPFPGPDAYVHAIQYAETRLYLHTVLENYAMYRFIYADAPVPSIR